MDEAYVFPSFPSFLPTFIVSAILIWPVLEDPHDESHDESDTHDHDHDANDQATMQIGILQWWLDKIDEALSELGLAAATTA